MEFLFEHFYFNVVLLSVISEMSDFKPAHLVFFLHITQLNFVLFEVVRYGAVKLIKGVFSASKVILT